DSGIGMKKETLDKIFDPFFTTKSKGTGLGLSICYSIIKSQQGELVFESEEGKGTTASIYLPYLQSKP
ncbi:MAG: ATP-binding protein, partial [Candidatus Omnitrophica bacterium]|nr:ATP-binding protein [Candidatus Omnitrophota bacterium]